MSKTKVFAALLAALSFAQGFGFIHLTPEQLQALQTLLGSGVIWGFRDAIAKGPEQ